MSVDTVRRRGYETHAYASAVGSLMYAMLCTRPDICYAVGVVSRFQSNPGLNHWIAVKHILKYLRRTRDYMLVYSSDDLKIQGYTDSDFQGDRDSRKSTSGSVFTLGGAAVVWRSVKQSSIADSTMEAEYIAASKVAKEAVWLKNFLSDMEVVPNMDNPSHFIVIIVVLWQTTRSLGVTREESTLRESITSYEKS